VGRKNRRPRWWQELRARSPISWPLALAAAVAAVAAVIAHLPTLTGGNALRVYIVFAVLAVAVVATSRLWRRFTDIGPAPLVSGLALAAVAFFAVLTMALPHVSALGSVYDLALHNSARQPVDLTKLVALIAAAAFLFTSGFAFRVWRAKRQPK